jgi:hypothetical protein
MLIGNEKKKKPKELIYEMHSAYGWFHLFLLSSTSSNCLYCYDCFVGFVISALRIMSTRCFEGSGRKAFALRNRNVETNQRFFWCQICYQARSIHRDSSTQMYWLRIQEPIKKGVMMVACTS